MHATDSGQANESEGPENGDESNVGNCEFTEEGEIATHTHCKKCKRC